MAVSFFTPSGQSSVNQTLDPRFFSEQPLPGYVSTTTQMGKWIHAPVSHVDWVTKAADIMASNILHNWRAAGGKPEGWDESIYGSWSAIVMRNAGQETMNAGDYKQLVNWLNNGYTPRNGDWFNIHVGQYIPPSQYDWMMSPDDIVKYRENEAKAQEKELERQVKLMQLQIELSRASRSSSSGSSTRYYGGGGGVGGGLDPFAEAKLELDWFIARNNVEIQQGRLDLERIQLEFDMQYKQALLDFQRQEAEYNRQLELEKIRTQRGLAVAQTMANPNDALQREYMLRHYNKLPVGQEPVGTLVDMFTGNSGGPGTWSQGQNINAQNWGFSQINPAPQNQWTPDTENSPNAPQFASGTTTNNKTEYGHTRERFFIVGDSEDGRPTGNEELIINHDRGRITVIPNKHLKPALSALYAGRVKYATQEW